MARTATRHQALAPTNGHSSSRIDVTLLDEALRRSSSMPEDAMSGHLRLLPVGPRHCEEGVRTPRTSAAVAAAVAAWNADSLNDATNGLVRLFSDVVKEAQEGRTDEILTSTFAFQVRYQRHFTCGCNEERSTKGPPQSSKGIDLALMPTIHLGFPIPPWDTTIRTRPHMVLRLWK
eukprot:scaffold6112_cov226-Pinguiococcus_pyrenoidosus.AAC.2